MGRVEPVFSKLRHNKRLARLNYRGQAKVRMRLNRYCMVLNSETLSKAGLKKIGFQ